MSSTKPSFGWADLIAHLEELYNCYILLLSIILPNIETSFGSGNIRINLQHISSNDEYDE